LIRRQTTGTPLGRCPIVRNPRGSRSTWFVRGYFRCAPTVCVLTVTDALSGKQVAQVPIGKGPDAAAFDVERSLVFSSNGRGGTLTVIHEDDPDHYSVIANAVTQKSARTMALDAKTHLVYLVAAEFGATAAPTPDRPHPRPPVIDGSFKVQVVGN
jgi:hypothetical protein